MCVCGGGTLFPWEMTFSLNTCLSHAQWGVGTSGATRPSSVTVGVARWPLSPSFSGVTVQNGTSAKSHDAAWNFVVTFEGQNHNVHPSTRRFCCEWDPDNDNVLESTKSSLEADPKSEQSPEHQHTMHVNYFLPSALERPRVLCPHPSDRTSLLCGRRGRQRSNCRNNTVSLPVNFLFFNNDKWFSRKEHGCSSEQFSSAQFVTGQLDKISTTQ